MCGLSGEAVSQIKAAAPDTIMSQTDSSRVIQGKVTSVKDGKPLPGVAIVIKGTKEGTAVDSAGRYKLEVPEENNTLVFTLLGYDKKEIDIKGRTRINVSLKQNIKSMEDVVVIGYGTQRKEDLTGSISSIGENDINKESITSADQALQGQVAGVQVTKNSGAPGGGSTVRIRGTNSIRAGNNPLYVIDGMPVGGGSGPSQNPLALINPSDVISIDVLKDASATAIYGSRGANGVVLITTRRGQAGDTQVNFETFFGYSQVRKKLNLLNSSEWLSLANEAAVNDNIAPIYTNSPGTYPNTDWQDEVFRLAPKQNYQLTVSGGDKDTRFAISASFLDEKGILLGSDFTRGSFRINLDKKVSKRFTIGNSLTLSKVDYSLVQTGGRGLGGIVNGALQIAPIVPVKDSTGSYAFQADGTLQRSNPVASALEKTNENRRFRGLGNLYAEYNLTKGLQARVSIGGDLNYRKMNYFAPKTTLEGQEDDSRAEVATVEQFTWVNENTLTYHTDFLDKHTLNLLAGFTLQNTSTENLAGSSQGFITDAFSYNNLNAGELPDHPISGASNSSLVSYIGRVNYGFEEKYLFTATGRIDGSSRFGKGNKYGIFPSGAFAWRISKEPFVRSLDFISNLKLRLSYGITGNQQINNYAALTQLGNSQVTFGDRVAVGINPASLGNEDLKWEKTAQYNAGLDIGLFNNRLTLTGDIYYKKTTNLLLFRRVPRYTGYSQYLDNIGSTENRGLELSLSTQNITNKTFRWTSTANFSMNRNKVLKLSDGKPLLVGTPIEYASGQSFRIIQEGKSLGSFYGYSYGGVYRDQDQVNNSTQPNAEPGDPFLVDISGPDGSPDGHIDANDQSIIGDAFPDFTFGLTNSFFYKGFDLKIFIQGSYGNDILNMNTLRLESVRGYTNQTKDVLNRWTPDNRNTDIPKASRKRSSASQTATRAISSRLIEDGSYIRLKNITLGYTLPANWIQRVGGRSVRLYASVQNIFTLTRYSGYDPEVSTYNNLGNLGADYGTYPKAKTYLIGVNLGF